jgi:hypothetical protein
VLRLPEQSEHNGADAMLAYGAVQRLLGLGDALSDLHATHKGKARGFSVIKGVFRGVSEADALKKHIF